MCHSRAHIGSEIPNLVFIVPANAVPHARPSAGTVLAVVSRATFTINDFKYAYTNKTTSVKVIIGLKVH